MHYLIVVGCHRFDWGGFRNCKCSSLTFQNHILLQNVHVLSTQTAWVQVTHDLLPASDTGLSSFFIFLVSFDTVDHIGSLQNLNIPSSCVPQGLILDPLLLTIYILYNKYCLLGGWSPIICPGKAWYHRCILRYVLLLWKLDWDGQTPPVAPALPASIICPVVSVPYPIMCCCGFRIVLRCWIE